MEKLAKSFPIKNGICYLFDDRVEIHTGGLMEKLNIRHLFLPYLTLLIAFGLAAAISAWIQNYFLVAFFVSAMIFTLYFLWTHRNLSLASVIPTKQIHSVQYIAAVPGQARASFRIAFQNGKKTRYRIIQLPPTHQQGAVIAQSAQQMFLEAGLLSP